MSETIYIVIGSGNALLKLRLCTEIQLNKMKNNFNIGSLFHQQGYSFNIHFTIDKKLMKEITQRLENGDIYFKGKEDYNFFFIVNTGKDVIELNIKKSHESKKNMLLEYVIYIPYEDVTKRKNHVEMTFVYLDYLKLGIEKVFDIYEANTNDLKMIIDKIKAEVLQNPDFYFVPSED